MFSRFMGQRNPEKDEERLLTSLRAARVFGVNNIFTAAYGSRPAASNDGDLFLPSDGFVTERDTGSAWVPWGPLYPFTAPVNGDFAWINQGDASVSTTNGGIYLFKPAATGNELRIRKKTAPSVPYVIEVAFLMNVLNIDSQRLGVLFRNNSDGKIHIFALVPGTSLTQLTSETWNSESSLDTQYELIRHGGGHGSLMFFKIEDNNTDRICSWSADGQNYIQFHSIGRTDFLTADEVGFFVAPINATYDTGLTLLSWKES